MTKGKIVKLLKKVVCKSSENKNLFLINSLTKVGLDLKSAFNYLKYHVLASSCSIDILGDFVDISILIEHVYILIQHIFILIQHIYFSKAV